MDSYKLLQILVSPRPRVLRARPGPVAARGGLVTGSAQHWQRPGGPGVAEASRLCPTRARGLAQGFRCTHALSAGLRVHCWRICGQIRVSLSAATRLRQTSEIDPGSLRELQWRREPRRARRENGPGAAGGPGAGQEGERPGRRPGR